MTRLCRYRTINHPILARTTVIITSKKFVCKGLTIDVIYNKFVFNEMNCFRMVHGTKVEHKLYHIIDNKYVIIVKKVSIKTGKVSWNIFLTKKGRVD